MTGRRFHRTTEAIPRRPWKSKSPFASRPMKININRATRGGAREVQRGTSSICFRRTVPPVVQSCWSRDLREGKPRGFQTGGLPTFFGTRSGLCCGRFRDCSSYALLKAEKEEKDKSENPPDKSGKSEKIGKPKKDKKDKSRRTSPDREAPPFEILLAALERLQLELQIANCFPSQIVFHHTLRSQGGIALTCL